MKRTILMAAMLTSPVVVHAQADRQQAAQIFLPNSGPRGDQDYRSGDYILRLPLRWESAARLKGGVSVRIGEQSLTIANDALLPLVEVQEKPGAGPFFKAYCTARKSPPKLTGAIGVMGLLSNSLHRSWTDAQTCLIDKDSDGKFDYALLIGDGGAMERVPHPIEAVGYAVEKDSPISPGDEVIIRLGSVSVKRVTFTLEITQHGVSQTFDAIAMEDGQSADRVTKASIKEGLPAVVHIFGADFRIVAANAAGKTVKLNWPDEARADVRRTIPELVRIR